MWANVPNVMVALPNFAALNRGRHLYSAGRPSRCALDHILVVIVVTSLYELGLFLEVIKSTLCVTKPRHLTSYHNKCTSAPIFEIRSLLDS